MTDPQDIGPARPTGAHGEHRTGSEAQAEETAMEAADAAARSGSTDAPVPDDAISAAAARVGGDRSAEPVADPGAEREVTGAGDPDRRE